MEEEDKQLGHKKTKTFFPSQVCSIFIIMTMTRALWASLTMQKIYADTQYMRSCINSLTHTPHGEAMTELFNKTNRYDNNKTQTKTF